MPFHIPDIADDLTLPTWDAVRRHLQDQGFPTTSAQIEHLAFTWDGAPARATVGAWFPGTRDHVLIILQSPTPDTFYVCTPMRGVIGGKPYPIVGLNAEATAFE